MVLITGMSGTGKSAALAELARRGHRVVDTDYSGWIEDVRLPDGSVEPLWDEERIDALLSGHSDGALFVVGTVANQGKFYPRFDAVVLLSAPLDVILERVATRESNPYGKTEAERKKIASDLAMYEPLLRAGATVEIDARRPLDEDRERARGDRQPRAGLAASARAELARRERLVTAALDRQHLPLVLRAGLEEAVGTAMSSPRASRTC